MSRKSASGSPLFLAGDTVDQELAFVTAPLTLATNPAGITFAAASTAYLSQIDFAGARQARLTGRVSTVSASAATPKLVVRYSPTFSVTAANFLPLAENSADVGFSMFTGADLAMADSGWVNITGLAYQPNSGIGMVAGLFTIGGDGVASPIVNYVTLYLR